MFNCRVVGSFVRSLARGADFAEFAQVLFYNVQVMFLAEESTRRKWRVGWQRKRQPSAAGSRSFYPPEIVLVPISAALQFAQKVGSCPSGAEARFQNSSTITRP